MNIAVWASLQRLDVLSRLDLLLPDLVAEKDLEEIRRKKLRRRRGYGSNRVQSNSIWKIVGAALVVLALAMLAPGPVDYFAASVGARIGFALGGPVGAVIGAFVGLVVYNVAALVILGIGTWLVANG